MGDGYPAKRERTRTALVRSALAIVGEHGRTGLTASAIAERAGVSHGTFYNHLDGTSEVLTVLAEELASIFELGSEALQRLSGDPAARAARGLLQLLDLHRTDPVFGRALVRMVATDVEFRSRIRAVVADEVRRGAEAGVFEVDDVDATTDAFLGASLQSLRSSLLGESRADRHVMAVACLAVLRMDDPQAVLGRVEHAERVG